MRPCRRCWPCRKLARRSRRRPERARIAAGLRISRVLRTRCRGTPSMSNGAQISSQHPGTPASSKDSQRGRWRTLPKRVRRGVGRRPHSLSGTPRMLLCRRSPCCRRPRRPTAPRPRTTAAEPRFQPCSQQCSPPRSQPRSPPRSLPALRVAHPCRRPPSMTRRHRRPHRLLAASAVARSPYRLWLLRPLLPMPPPLPLRARRQARRPRRRWRAVRAVSSRLSLRAS